MTRARQLSKLGNPNVFSVDTDLNVGVNSTSPTEKLNVVGVVSATSFIGNLSGTAVTSTTFTGALTGNADTATNASGLTGTPDITVRNITGVGMTLSGTLSYEDVTNIDSVGIITAQSGIRVGAGESIGSDGAAVVYYGDGSKLTNLPSGGDSLDVTASLFI